MFRITLLAMLAAGCSQRDDAQMDRMEAQLNRIEANQHQLPAPMSKVEYDEMPTGTKFLAPDGTTRIKPAKGPSKP